VCHALPSQSARGWSVHCSMDLKTTTFKSIFFNGPASSKGILSARDIVVCVTCCSCNCVCNRPVQKSQSVSFARVLGQSGSSPFTANRKGRAHWAEDTRARVCHTLLSQSASGSSVHCCPMDLKTTTYKSFFLAQPPRKEC